MSNNNNSSHNNNSKQLLKFPCEFPIKVVSYSSFELEHFTTNVVHKHIPEMEHIPVSKNISKQGNYQAITVTVRAQNQKQLDSIYQELSSNKAIIMVL